MSVVVHLTSRRISNGKPIKIEFEDLGETMQMSGGRQAYTTRFKDEVESGRAF